MSRSPLAEAAPPRAVAGTGDQIAVAIRRRILDGSLEPGQRLTLRTIADELGVSFIPVREALRTLESQGLVVARPGRSTVVAQLSREELHSIYRLRLRIEPEIAYRACELLTAEDAAGLERLLVRLREPDLGFDEVYDVHHQFHVELLRPAATEWDLRVLESLWHASERYVRQAFGGLDRASGEHERRYAVHRTLLDAFLSRDSDRGSSELRQHLAQNERIAVDALHL